MLSEKNPCKAKKQSCRTVNCNLARKIVWQKNALVIFKYIMPYESQSL